MTPYLDDTADADQLKAASYRLVAVLAYHRGTHLSHAGAYTHTFLREMGATSDRWVYLHEGGARYCEEDEAVAGTFGGADQEIMVTGLVFSNQFLPPSAAKDSLK
jgi:hypothetical protein